MSSDPLRDDRFPDRPQHPDFWRLAEVAMSNDGDATEGGKGPFEILDVDEQSFMYLARTRLGRFLEARGGIVDETALVTIYIDAFALGKRFAERGGHQDAGR